MPGQPQVREAARLYRSGDRQPRVPLVLVRLEQRMDGSGIWDLYVHDPAPARPQHAAYGSEADARAALARVYEWGAVDGEWEPSARSRN